MRSAAHPPGELTIERARLSGPGSRGALEAALAHVRVSDVASGEEILVVPRLRAGQRLSARRSPSDFGTRLTDQLRALRAGAQIDPHGPVPGAAALRFTSKARYAAWLVALWLRDVPAGGAAESFAVPEPAEIRRWLACEVFSDGPVLVATAGRLRFRRLLALWIVRLTPPELALADRAIERAYAVTVLAGTPFARAAPGARAARRPPPMPAAPPFELRADARSALSLPVDGETRTTRLLTGTWAELAQEDMIAEALPPAQARLALALAVLARQPNIARRLTPALLDRARPASPVAPPEAQAELPVWTARPRPVSRKGPARTALESPRGSLSPPAADAAALEDGAPPAARPASGRSERRPVAAPTAHAAVRRQAEPASPPLPETPLAGFGTGFGGVFFLLNALLALGLYSDFTRPADKGLAPSPFWLIDRLALRLLGRAYRSDPLHRWLAAVGLPGPLPGAWEVDPGWLDGLPPALHGPRRSRTRTILWDSRGFALLDAPAALRATGRPGPAGRLPPLPRRRMPRDAEARWIACLAEFLGVRLALAGLDAAALRLPGRVTADEERVEISFDLARLPIELRLAGLDRDPGWLPAEGRSIRFRFE